MNTTTQTQTKFFEITLSVYAGSNERKALDKDALRQMGFQEVDFDAVKAMLQTAVLPKEAFYPFLAIRKSVQDFLGQKGQKHPLLGYIFNPKERVEILQFLREKKEEYETQKNEFLKNYQLFINEQLEKVENSARVKGLDPVPLLDAVRSHQPSVEYYRKKLEFRFLDKTIELDSKIWEEELKRINSDLRYKTAFDLSRDAASIRNYESPRTRARKLIELSKRLKSLDFYIDGLEPLGKEIETVVNHYGGIKPAKNYSQQEALMLQGIARILEEYSSEIVLQGVDFEYFFNNEASRISSILEDEQEVETHDLEIKPIPESQEKEGLISEEEDEFKEISNPAPTKSSIDPGLFSF